MMTAAEAQTLGVPGPMDSASQRLKYAKNVDLHPDETIANLLN